MQWDRAKYRRALTLLERELDLEWEKAEMEQDEPGTRTLGLLRMILVLDRSQALSIMKARLPKGGDREPDWLASCPSGVIF